MSRPCRWKWSLLHIFLSLAILLGAPPAFAAVSLVAEPPPPQPVGTEVTWRVTGLPADPSDYRLVARAPGGAARITYDFSSRTAFEWVRLQEGVHTVVLQVRDRNSGDVTTLPATDYMLTSRVTSIDLGLYSSALGSAQQLANGNLHFNSGLAEPPPTPLALSEEYLPDGTRSNAFSAASLIYRSFRMRDLYTPPPN